MEPQPLDVLYEDNHVLAVNKPAGVPSAHFAGREETLDRVAKAYLKEKYAKPGEVYLGVVHRLDKPTSGVLLFARTSKAAARLCDEFRAGTVEKVYWAVAEGQVDRPTGTWEDSLIEDEAAGRVRVAEDGEHGARACFLDFTRYAARGGLSLLELRPGTGRKHQLRVQLASRGHPIYGDGKYGSRRPFGQAVALHAGSITFQHPTKHEPITLTAAIPQTWRERFGALLTAGGLS